MSDFFPKSDDGFNFLLSQNEIETVERGNEPHNDAMNLEIDEFLCF